MTTEPTIEKGAFEIINKLIMKLTENELQQVNQKVIERLNLMHSARQLNLVASFSVNDKIVFDYHGQELHATILRLNRKTVSIIDEYGSHWSISPVFIKKRLS